MSQTAKRLIKTSLSALHYSGVARLLAQSARGLGAVLMLHHVRPASDRGFQPNGILEITPDFLETVILEIRRAGFDIVSLDEAHARMTGVAEATRPFVAFTFDDGYRDNRDFAFPVMRRYDVPFTVYIASDFADRRGFLWWLVLERVIAARHAVTVEFDGVKQTLACGNDRDKTAAFERIYWQLRNLPERDARAIVAALADESGIDPLAPCRELAMTWSEIREFARNPLVTIGAHTVGHYALAKLDADEAEAEIANSVARIERELGRPCHHFCYPYGDEGSAGEREFEATARIGIRTAVTTRKGFIYQDTATRLTALPRVSLNGEYQRVSYLRALLSGVPFALLRAVKRKRSGAPAQSPAVSSGFCIQRTSHAAGTTHANPPTTKNNSSPSLLPLTSSTTATSIARNA